MILKKWNTNKDKHKCKYVITRVCSQNNYLFVGEDYRFSFSLSLALSLSASHSLSRARALSLSLSLSRSLALSLARSLGFEIMQ